MTPGSKSWIGMWELYLPGEEASNNTQLEHQLMFGFQLRLPSWFSSRGLDSMLLRGQGGWKYLFRPMNLHAVGSEADKLVGDIMRAADPLRKLKYFLTTGQIGIHDEFLEEEDGFPDMIIRSTLLDVSVYVSFLFALLISLLKCYSMQ